MLSSASDAIDAPQGKDNNAALLIFHALHF